MKNTLFVIIILLLLSACSMSRQKLSPQGNLNLKSANVYYQQKDNEASLNKALDLYTKVLKDNPQHVIALKRSGDLLLYFASQIEPKETKDEDGKSIYPNMDNAAKTIDYFKQSYGKYDSVLTVMNTFEKLNDDERAMKRDADRKKESSWVRMYKIGQLYYYTNDFPEAIKILEMVYNLDTTRKEPLRMLVLAYQETGDQDKIELYLNKVLQDDPDDLEMIKMMGAHYYKNKNYSKAVEYFNKVLEKEPINTDNMLLIYSAYSLEKEYQSAYDILVKILKLKPDNVEVLGYAKDLAIALENKTAEIDYWKRILALEPSIENIEKYCLRMIRIEHFEGVMPYAEKWFQKEPTNKLAVTACAVVASRIGRKDLEKKYNDILKRLE